MDRLFMAAMALAGASGCAAQQDSLTQSEAIDCSATTAQQLIGQPKTKAIEKKAIKLTGAATVRWIGPGQSVTMDYRTDRLNIETSADDDIIRIRCG